MKITREMNLNFTRLLTLVPSHFLHRIFWRPYWIFNITATPVSLWRGHFL